MSNLREKFRKKKIDRLIPVEEKLKKLKRKKIYVKERCHFINPNTGNRCHHNCIGSGQLCRKHGGTLDIENTLSTETLELMKNELGYVTKFDPGIHPLMMIDLSRQGLSEVEIAAEMGVSVETLKKWADRFKDMATAFEIGKALHESWWLAKGKEGLDSKFFNTSLYKFLTGNKLGYSDKIETKNTNLNLHGVLVAPKQQSLEEWEEGAIDV